MITMTTTQAGAVSREAARLITEEINTAVQAILARHGLEAGKSSSGYGDYYQFKITANAVQLNERGVNLQSNEAQAWLVNAFQYNFTREQAEAALGKTFTSKGKTMKFLGFESRRPKFPVYAEDTATGERFFLTEPVLEKVRA